MCRILWDRIMTGIYYVNINLLSDDTDLGSVVNAKSLENMEGIVSRTINSGAELLTGGERAYSKGYFFRPTIFIIE